jgi:hypothetical protein
VTPALLLQECAVAAADGVLPSAETLHTLTEAIARHLRTGEPVDRLLGLTSASHGRTPREEVRRRAQALLLRDAVALVGRPELVRRLGDVEAHVYAPQDEADRLIKRAYDLRAIPSLRCAMSVDTRDITALVRSSAMPPWEESDDDDRSE